MSDHDYTPSPQPQKPDPVPLLPEGFEPTDSNRGWVVGAVILGVIVLVAVGAVAAYRTLVGQPFAAAEAVPPDADFVISFDLLQVRDTDRINRLANAFAEPLVEAGEIESAEIDILERIDEELEAEFGITLTDDVVPWIGRSVSMAGWVPGDLEVEPDVLLSMAVRDSGGAAAFIEKVADQATIDFGGFIERSEVRGGDRWTVTDEGDTLFVVWLDSDVLLMAPSMRVINRALDAREGNSLLDESAFNEVVAELPSDRLLTMYFGPALFESLTDLTTALTGQITPETEIPALEAIGIGFTLRDDGIQFDVAQVQDNDSEPAVLEAPADAVSTLPIETLGYVAFTIPEGLVDESVIESLRSVDPFAYESLAEEAERMLGVDLFDELLPALGGDAVIAVIEARTGVIAQQGGVPLGLVGALGVVDRSPVATALASVEGLIADTGLVVVDGEPTIIGADGEEFVAYALTSDALVIGSPTYLVEDYVGGDGGLTDSNVYRELDAALVGDGLLFYVDLERSLDLAQEFDTSIPEFPLRGMGASGAIDGRVSRGSMLILIDY